MKDENLVKCPECDGKGFKKSIKPDLTYMCNICFGTGKIEKDIINQRIMEFD